MLNKVPYVALTIALSLLLVGSAFTASTLAAPWITPVPEIQTFAADWVKQIQDELVAPELRWTFANDPRAPQPAILKFLNQAAQAMKDGNTELAKDFVIQALGVVEKGAELGYYSSDDMASVKHAIVEHLPKDLA